MPNPSDFHTFDGSCHCGAIGYTFRASQRPELWTIRACQCRFCRGHGARTTSDPEGSVIFRISDPSQLEKYRFGLKSADFLICKFCGVYLASVLTAARGQFATLNVNAIATSIFVPDAQAVTYENETLAQRQARREQRWTPVSEAV